MARHPPGDRPPPPTLASARHEPNRLFLQGANVGDHVVGILAGKALGRLHLAFAFDNGSSSYRRRCAPAHRSRRGASCRLSSSSRWPDSPCRPRRDRTCMLSRKRPSPPRRRRPQAQGQTRRSTEEQSFSWLVLSHCELLRSRCNKRFPSSATARNWLRRSFDYIPR